MKKFFVSLQNTPSVSAFSKALPTISIRIDDKEWEDAYNNFINGKPPTNSILWKRGVFLVRSTKPF